LPDKDAEGEQHDADYEFYVYEEGEPRYSFWMYRGDRGMCLYDRPPEDHGMWLKPQRDHSDYEPDEPTKTLRKIVATLVAQEEVDAELLKELPPHEQHFVQVLHGTANDKPEAMPDSVWSWMWDCHDELGVIET